MEPAEVLGACQPRTGSVGDVEVLIHWQGMPAFDANWESFSTIQHHFPLFHLEDKVQVWAAGIDKPPVHFTYVRRNKRQGQKGNSVEGLPNVRGIACRNNGFGGK